ncbi:TIGR02301 family protein [Bauldia sp.]|uniref:TIGR02301 family protein n=1 Tax=Bauldia sp. TaxID=2575872 RepID=UPI003BA8AEC7
MPKPIVAIVLAALVTVAAATGGTAQEAEAPAPDIPPPPYDDQLLRLSEILGALHYLRELCDSDEGSLWRDEMQALIDAEEADPVRRTRFVDRFNRGYGGFSAVYRNCTPAAALAIDRYMDEGQRIARDIVARYGRQE